MNKSTIDTIFWTIIGIVLAAAAYFLLIPYLVFLKNATVFIINNPPQNGIIIKLSGFVFLGVFALAKLFMDDLRRKRGIEVPYKDSKGYYIIWSELAITIFIMYNLYCFFFYIGRPADP